MLARLAVARVMKLARAILQMSLFIFESPAESIDGTARSPEDDLLSAFYSLGGLIYALAASLAVHNM